MRYNITIEVRYIALKGKAYGCTYKESLRSHDGDEFLHIIVSSYSESRIWDCTEGKGIDRKRGGSWTGYYVWKSFQNGEGRSNRVCKGRRQKKNIPDHGSWKRSLGTGIKKNQQVVP